MLVVGDKFSENGEVGLRKHRDGDLGSMPLEEVKERLSAARVDPE
jgi:threonyl-tRNA synthetase